MGQNICPSELRDIFPFCGHGIDMLNVVSPPCIEMKHYCTFQIQKWSLYTSVKEEYLFPALIIQIHVITLLHFYFF